MKYLKIWEAIALLLILGSWCLEWNSMQKWSDVNDNYWRAIFSSQNGAIRITEQIQTQFELSINRSVNGSKLDPHDFASAYRLAWDYAEVRKLWYERALSKIYRLNVTIKELIWFKDNYDLSVKYDIEKFNIKIQDIKNNLVKYVDKKDPTSKIVPIPKKEALSLIQAGNLDNKIGDLLSEIITPINEVGNSIKTKREMWSFIFRTLFAVGSLIMISVKIGEWFKDRNASYQD